MAIETIDIGDTVLCDDCNADYTTRKDSGGFLFGSKAICPECQPKWLDLAQKHNETHHITQRCPEGMSFADWCRRLRGGNNTITSYSGDDAIKAIFGERGQE